ncbi:MAG: transporter substrate-binding domain-containing protein [Desulfuromusa sp.]|jgi:two-component system cell cycle sensor histidine kinase/response regulator CckA|nr:transporter substrate-binding domain-containing protein [Desulfuromusa sp.]
MKNRALLRLFSAVVVLIVIVCFFEESRAAELSFTAKEQSWLETHKSIRLSGPQAFPPFQYFTQDGSFEGMASDYIFLIAELVGLQVEIMEKQPWPEVLSKIKNKQIDVLSCSARSSERDSYLDYSNPHLSFPLIIVSKKDGPFISGIESLHNRRIVFVKKNVVYEWVKKTGITFTPHFVNSPLEALKEISLGKADAAIENLAAASYLIEHNGLTNLKIAAPTAFEDYSLSIAVRKDWPELVSIFNKALAAIPKEKHNEIHQRWISVRYEHGISKRSIALWAGGISAIVIVILLLTYVWGRSLKREIIKRAAVETKRRESEEKYRTAFTTSPDSINLNRLVDGVYVEINDGFTWIMGYKPDEVIGKSSKELNIWKNQEDREELVRRLSDRGYAENLEAVFVAKDGTLKNGLMSARLVVIAGEKLILSITRDITARKKIEQERLDLETQLRQKYKMDSIGVMAGGMAHNFNNNLSIILGNIELSKMKMPSNLEIDSYLSNAKIAVLRSRDLIQQILTYSRQNSKDKTSIQLPLIIDETLQLLRSTMPTTMNLQQRISSNSYDLTINADSSQIQECLINLCNNAMHAMEEEGDLTIALDSVELQKQDIPVQYKSQPGHYAKLSVQDTGSGMSAETIDKIFDLFFTTKPVDEGTGVGLSSVQGIVTQHGGLIKVNSRLGEGTTFELYFPVTEQTQPTETISVNEDMPGGTEHILFVDDDPMLVSLGEEMLKIKGYTVTTMTDSTEALKLFTADPAQFDLVITDQTMPDLTGKELIQKLKEIRSDIPTIICTGFSSKVDEDNAEELGASAFLMKPLDIQKLLQTVRRILDGDK